MKKIFTILAAAVLTANVYAQVPQMMTYQSVVRNSGGALVTNAPVGVRVTILQDSATGTPVYQEVYSPKPHTNGNGLVSLQVGGGVALLGTVDSIKWGTTTFFIKTETDPTGGTNYTISGTSQLLSVPYALYAKTAAYAASTSTTIVAGSSNGGNSPTITSGSGFTISAIGINTGQYQITFNVPFTSTPSITTTLYGLSSGDNGPFSTVTSVTTSGFQVNNYYYDAQSGVYGNPSRAFSFIAVGN